MISLVPLTRSSYESSASPVTILDALTIRRAIEDFRRETINDVYVRSKQAIHGTDPNLGRRRFQAALALLTADSLTFTAADLVERTGIEPHRVQAFLAQLSLAFGGAPAERRGTLVPGPTHPLKMRPLVVHDARYFCSLDILGVLHRIITPRLNPDSKLAASGTNSALWARFDAHRAGLVEDRTLDYLRRSLNAPLAKRGLKYVSPQDGNGELDGLVLVDDVAILIEVKAGALSEGARAGEPREFARDLRALGL